MAKKPNDVPKINARHPDYVKVLPRWTVINDCVAGQDVMREKATDYIPDPHPEDQSAEGRARYDGLVNRAVFHNITGRTAANMVGQCFAVPPVATLPESLELLAPNIDGAGVALSDLAKRALTQCVQKSRCGLLADYPRREEDAPTTTIADLESGKIRPKLILFDPEQIINWSIREDGAKIVLDFIMIEEVYEEFGADGYEIETGLQWRELRMIGGVYNVTLWRQDEAGLFVPQWTAQPKSGAGEPFTEIPFTFIGAEANDYRVEKPMLLDIANLNVGHFVNSAEYEELTHFVGSPTAYATGLTEKWVENVMKGTFTLGSRAVVPLPENATTGFLQPEAVTLPYEAMQHKEGAMVSLGAQLVEKQEVVQTATEKSLREASAGSVLASCCNNVSDGVRQGLIWALAYLGVDADVAEDSEELVFKLNTDFAVSRMASEERAQNRADYDGGLLSYAEARQNLKEGGIAFEDDDKVLAEKEEKEEAELERMLSMSTPAPPSK